jgi:diadenylate cyclase
MARSVDVPVISISEDMGVIAVWVNDYKHTVEDITRQLSRANRALATLERYVARLGEVTGMLASLEVEDLVTVRDVAGVLQRAEMVHRISEEIRAAIVELGADGRLVGLQLDEVLGDMSDQRPVVVADYVRAPVTVEETMARLAELSDRELVDLRCVASALGSDDLDESLQSRGYRMLARVPRLSEDTAERVVERFVTLQQLMRASVDDLVSIDGVDAREAKSIKDGLARITESSILDRYA